MDKSIPAIQNPFHIGVVTSRIFWIFSLFWCWEAVLLYVPSIHNDGIGTSLLWNTSNYVWLVVCMFLALFHERTQRFIGTRSFDILLIILLELGTLAIIIVSYFFEGQLTVWQHVMSITGGIIVSIGILLMDILLVKFLINYQSETHRNSIIIGSMASHLLLYLLVDNLPPALILVCVLVLPLFVGVLIWPNKSIHRASTINPDHKQITRELKLEKESFPLPIKYLVAFFLLSFSINFIRNAILAQIAQTESALSFSNSSVISLTLSIFLLAAVIEFVFRKRHANTLVPLIVTILIALAIFFNQLFEDFQEITLALTFTGFFLYVTIFYGTAAKYASADKNNVVKIAIAVLASNSLGLSTGSAVWGIIGSSMVDIAPIVSLVLSYIIFIAGMLLFFSSQIKGTLAGFSSLKPGSDFQMNPGNIENSDVNQNTIVRQPSLTLFLERNCDLIADCRTLTQREREALQLLARRKNYLQIANAMKISANTAKSHIRHIYQKLGIHSAEELFALLEDIDQQG